MRLLMIDDDEVLADAISQYLIQHHYAVDIATNGQMGLEFIDLFTYDLIILDLVLPDLDGSTICSRIRANQHRMPILMLTARDNTEDKIQGLDAGADEYIVKPIKLPELLARIRALLRRASTTTPTQLCWGLLEMSPNRLEVTYDQQPVTLTPKEYSILELFLRNPHNNHTLDGIIDNIWALENPPSLYAIRTHIKSIRHKLRELGAPTDFIETLYGFGYRLNPAYHQAERVLSEQDFDHESGRRSAQIAAMTQNLWLKHQGEIEARIQTLERVVQAVEDQAITDELQQQGIDIAHKLAGALGCFSFSQGSKLAQHIEIQLQSQSYAIAQGHLLQDLVSQLRQSIHFQPCQPHESSQLRDRKHLLVYSHEHELLQILQEEAPSYGFSLTSVLDPNTLIKQIQMRRPDVMLLDFESPNPCSTLPSLLKEKAPSAPILAILHHHQWKKRLDYIHQGVCCIFQYPASVPSILDAAHHFDLLHHSCAKILVVDDDPLLLAVINRHLSTCGFDVTTLESPNQFWSQLQAIQPDLVILDIDMPGSTGIELCQLLRADPDWAHIPVILLSSHVEAQIEDQAFMAGADDVISKDCPVQRLTLRINNRLR